MECILAHKTGLEIKKKKLGKMLPIINTEN